MVVPIGIVVLIGLPASGKTTFSRKIVRKLSTSSYRCHTINYDSIIKDHNKDSYSRSRKCILDSVESLITSLRSKNLPCKQLILIDDNMYYSSMRYTYYKLARSFNLSFLQVFIDVDVNIALLRNSRRSGKIPEKVIEDMALRLEVPDSHRNHWERHTCRIKGIGDEAFNRFLEALMKSINDPVYFSETDIAVKVPVSRTRLQDIDILLRKLVGENIRNSVNCQDDLMRRKKEMFRRIRSGEIYLPIDWDDAKIMESLRLSL